MQTVHRISKNKMNTNHRYLFILDPTSRKMKCPQCGQKSFVAMINTETGEILGQYGRCDREVKCAYFQHPSADGFQNTISTTSQFVEIAKNPNFHHSQLVMDSLKWSNNLLNYFELVFGKYQAELIQKKYKIGTFPQKNFGTVFWQIDENNKVRGGKIINYLPTGKRTKKIDWVHSYLKRMGQLKEFCLSQCLFGLHLIREDKTSVIAIVESEKTACMMSVVFPEFLWMACGAKGEFKLSKLAPIQHRKIIAYPDCEIQKNGCTTFVEWKSKASKFNEQGFDISVSNLLEIETTAEQKIKGMDLADFFMM